MYIVSIEINKLTVWGHDLSLDDVLDFVRYVMGSCVNPFVFHIVSEDKQKSVPLVKVATQYGIKWDEKLKRGCK